MASKSDDKVDKPTKARSPRKTAARAAPEPVASPKEPGGAKGLLRAGRKALNDVRGAVITRHRRVFEPWFGRETWLSSSNRFGKEWQLVQAGDGAAGEQKYEAVLDHPEGR